MTKKEKKEDIVLGSKTKVNAKKLQTDSVNKVKVSKKETSENESKASTNSLIAQPIVEKSISIKKKTKKMIATMNDTQEPLQTQLTFKINFSTKFGQSLYISGNHVLFGNGDVEKALPLIYTNEQSWSVTIFIDDIKSYKDLITYNYVLKNSDGTISYDWGSDKGLLLSSFSQSKILITDSWNYAGYFENAFYSEPFKNVLLKQDNSPFKEKKPKTYTHQFKVKAPLITQGETICLLGSCKPLGNWIKEKLVILTKKDNTNYFEVYIDLGAEIADIEYKYAICAVDTKEIIRFEDGSNRKLTNESNNYSLSIINDGYAVLPANTWKGAGVAIPVFSLRTKNSFGVGEFLDIPAFVDWSKQVGIKMIQILPINDTTSTHTWLDSYPYASISAFALHPLYLNLENIALSADEKASIDVYKEEKSRLNSLDAVDYEVVMNTKWKIIQVLYNSQKQSVLESKDYLDFFNFNEHWLVPYACFCYLRDKYGTSEFGKWPAHNKFNKEELSELLDEKEEAFNILSLHFYVQFQLHKQLQSATNYAHQNGIILKGDIAIGISRNGADAWQNPTLYNMELQAGAPPDDFAIKGQNWGFPTYNWVQMKKDGFAWWKQRFEQMSYYFDAFRIDHILGFFRIWSIPTHAVEGIMGYFVPALPIHINELRERGIWYDIKRFIEPHITDSVIWDAFQNDHEFVKKNFLVNNGNGTYHLKPEVNTQHKVEQYLADWENDSFTHKVKYGLFDLISNVILLEVEGTNREKFHFRFGISGISSFKHLDDYTRKQLDDLYVNYFFRRQDNFWREEAMQKLPALKRVTNMLVCGEDLGLVPNCVPDVMQQLGILSLEIQRMPKDNKKSFFHPNDAPYLSVVTPSTHDMSTIRGWWEEDKTRIQEFYNQQLGQWGAAPYYCEDWINKLIVKQHLYAPAMWSVFQLQDLLGMDATIRRSNPNDERINLPANPKNYWRYRMHISIEDLITSESFNAELKTMIKESGR